MKVRDLIERLEELDPYDDIKVRDEAADVEPEIKRYNDGRYYILAESAD